MNINLQYIQESETLIRVSASSDGQTWEHFLSPDEINLLASDPASLDAVLLIQAEKSLTPPPVEPPKPFELKELRNVEGDSQKAPAVVTAHEESKVLLLEGLNSWLKKASALSVAQQLEILQIVSDITDIVLGGGVVPSLK